MTKKSNGKPEPAPEQWAIVEIFGHQRYAGIVSEHQLGGCNFVRVDVPQIDGEPAFTKLFGQAAIYSITPVAEQIARICAKNFQSRPLTVYVEELEKASTRRRIAASTDREEDDL